MSPSPEPAGITTRTILQAVYDYQRTFDASTGWARIELLTPWQTLCAAYPEEVVDAAYTREASSGHLNYGYCGCPSKCDLCVHKGPPARLTDEGHAKLTNLKGTA
ncbi:hypothetical protein [Streptomyces sp. NPDC088178]|uniref:hypothetical protein n=1 Tax=Streptomyces sp. NPDC088178 TaxID=3365836 RepID=UPI00382D3C85